MAAAAILDFIKVQFQCVNGRILIKFGAKLKPRVESVAKIIILDGGGRDLLFRKIAITSPKIEGFGSNFAKRRKMTSSIFEEVGRWWKSQLTGEGRVRTNLGFNE